VENNRYNTSTFMDNKKIEYNHIKNGKILNDLNTLTLIEWWAKYRRDQRAGEFDWGEVEFDWRVWWGNWDSI